MNVQLRVSKYAEVEMSHDGEVLIPEDVRRAAGLVPGMRVAIGINERGEAVVMSRIRAKRSGETPEQRRDRFDGLFAELASGRYSTGQSTADVMEELRGNRPA